MEQPFNGRVKLEENEDGYYAICNAVGNPVSDYYYEIEFYTPLLSRVYDEDKEKYALILETGNFASKWYDEIELLNNGLSKVYDDKIEKYALLSESGTLISSWFEDIDDFKNGFAEVTNDNDEYALIDQKGQIVTNWVQDSDELYSKENPLISNISDLSTNTDDVDTKTKKNNIMGLFDQLKDAGASMLFGETKAQPVNRETTQTQMQVQMQPTAQQSTSTEVYNPQLEKLINLALADGELTEKEKQVLFKKAEGMGIDLDEFEMVLEAKLYERSKSNNAQTSTAAPKSNKFGDIKKCPACGAVLQSFTTKCPDCGFEFRNVEANCTIQHLFELLNEVEANSKEDAVGLITGLGRAYSDMFAAGMGGNKDTRKKKAIIQNFPIPNTKEDILEFLTLAMPLAKKPGLFDQDMQKKEMYPVWKAKCEQIIMKAKFSMKDDPATLAEILEYGKQLGIK